MGVAAALVAVAGVSLGAVAGGGEALPERCPTGAFVVDGSTALLPDGSGTAVVVMVTRVGIGGTCGTTTARVRRTRRFTRITATWLACDGVAGKVRLRARIDAATCRTMSGEVRARRARVRRAFTAVRTRSGLSGRLVPPAGARADVDTGDLGPGADNDRSLTAQPLPIPALVGGGAYFRSATDRDDDVYALDLDGGPLTATLRVADPVALDLDLLLLDRDLRQLAVSRGSGVTETLAVDDATGAAYLVVFAFRGPFAVPAGLPWTAYTLALTRTGEAAVATDEDDVGPVHVRLLDADGGRELQAFDTSLAAGWRLDFPDPIAPGRYHVIAGTDRDGDGIVDEPGEAVARTIEAIAVGAAAVVLLELPLVEWGVDQASATPPATSIARTSG